jgi:molybdopterin converting factor small subunit
MTGMVRFVLPANWRTIAGESLTGLSCPADTVGQALHWLCGKYPVFAERIFASERDIAPWVLVCLDGADVRTLRGLDTEVVRAGHELHVIAALMGG